MSTESLNSEDTLGDFLQNLWAGRLFLIIGAVLGALSGFVFIAAAVPHVRADMILAPASPMNLAASINTTQQAYGRPASQTQGMSHDTGDAFTRFQVSYKGPAVAALLLRDPAITQGLSQDRAFTFSKAEEGWTVEKLSEYIEKRVKIDPVGETALREFSYFHPNRDFAVMFLQRLHNVADGLIRHGMRKDVNERIAYLNAAIGETLNPDNRRIITELLMEQERLKMLVSIDQPYAASVVVPSSASVKTRWPDAALVYTLFTALGALVGYLAFSLAQMRQRGVFADLDLLKVKQQEWFFPESGNSNEPPQKHKETQNEKKKRKPLTGKKPGKKSKKGAVNKPQSPNAGEAAE
ncbi:MAG: hypothetical protein AAF204_01415 [Pseudomonadota bacterium]